MDNVMLEMRMAISNTREPVIIMSPKFYYEFMKLHHYEYMNPAIEFDDASTRVFGCRVHVHPSDFDWIVATGYQMRETKHEQT